MNVTLLKNRVCRGSKGFYCDLCSVELVDEENATVHINSNERHLELKESSAKVKHLKIAKETVIELINNGIVPLNNKEYKCTFCTCHLPKLDHIPEHIGGKRHVTKRRKILPHFDNISATNSVSCKDQDKSKEETSSNEFINSQDGSTEKYYSNEPPVSNVPSIFCNICQDNLKNDSAVLYHKMFHLSQRSCNVTDIISFSIKENTRTMYCLICDYIIKSEVDLERHLKEIIHQKRLVILCCPNNSTIMNMIYLNTVLSYPNIAIPSNVNNIYNTLNVEFNRYLYYLGCNAYYNQTLQQNNYLNNKFFIENELTGTNSSLIQTQYNIEQNINIFSTYFCFICNTKFVDENVLFSHYTYDYIHKYRMEAIFLILKDKHMKFVTYFNNEVIKCLKCQVHLTELNGAISHLFDQQHIVEKHIENEKVVCNSTILLNNDNTCTNIYTCPICKINVTYDYIMVQHLESDYHKNRVQEYYTNVNSESFEKIVFCCALCKMNFFNDKTLLEHFYISHGFKNAIPTNMLIANSANLYLATNNAIGNDTINQRTQESGNSNYRNAVSEAAQNSNRNIKIRTRNLINFSPRYVKLCVETGDENIFKIHPEKIRKLQLGISLTFPYESERCCIPCGYEVPSDPQLLYEHFRTEEHENNLQDLEENDEFFENFRDQFSDLELAKSYMHEDSDEWIQCFACDIKIENCDEIIHKHIQSQFHIDNYTPWKNSANEIFNLFKNMFQNLWYYIEKFFCNLCSLQFEFEVDFARHLENSRHLKEVEKRIIRQQHLQFDCCILCSSYWYAKSDHHKIHCSKGSHKYILKSRNFTVPEMPDAAKNLLNTVEQTINALLKESDKVFYNTKDTERVLKSVEMVAKLKYPEVKAYLFGSRTSYIGFKDSDLDIYLDCTNQYGKRKSKEECQNQMLMIQECFHIYQDIWIIVEVVLRTRVPIIKLRHRPTNLECDVSFLDGLSVEKSKILGYFIKAYLPCRKMILFLKKWIVLCQLSGRKGISTFAISWLVVFYLQVKEILPSILHLIQVENNSKIIAGWETGVSSNIPIKETDLSIRDLLRGFFSYYAEFDYISNVVCPFLGKVMKKSKFSDINDLVEEMEMYQKQIKTEEVEFFRLDSPMCVQEPIDLSENITKSVTKLHLRMFKQYCAESAASLQTSNGP